MREFGAGYWADETDFKIRLQVDGKPAVLKNSRKVVMLGARCPTCKRGMKTASVPSTSAERWLKAARKQLPPQWPFNEAIPKRIRVSAKIVTYAHDRRARDLDNTYGCPQDAIQPHGDWWGIIEDDCQIASHDGSRLRYDKDNPRVEITLTPFIEDDES